MARRSRWDFGQGTNLWLRQDFHLSPRRNSGYDRSLSISKELIGFFVPIRTVGKKVVAQRQLGFLVVGLNFQPTSKNLDHHFRIDAKILVPNLARDQTKLLGIIG